MAGNTLQITPFMHVRDVGAAVRFFTDVLGFTVRTHSVGYAYVDREGAGIRIQRHDDAAELPTPHRGFAYYIDVKDLGAVLRDLGGRLTQLPPGDVHGPVNQAYGQRELMVRAPDGNLVVFGEAIQRAD
jgi:catechol 2,3-dioxygenase-like lactoylglutathione lyase family enzyme